MIFFLSGIKRSGKDTVANILVNEGIVYKSTAFADPLKSMIMSLFPQWGYSQLYGDDKNTEYSINNNDLDKYAFYDKLSFYEMESYNNAVKIQDIINLLLIKLNLTNKTSIITPRQVMVTLGTDICQKIIDKNIWVKIFHKCTLLTFLTESPNKNFCVTDCRFEHEYHYLNNLGAFGIGIERPSITNEGDYGVEGYVPEILKKCSIVLENNGTIEQLKDNLLYELGLFKTIKSYKITSEE